MLHTLLYFLALFALSTSPNWAKLNGMPVEILGFWRLGLAALVMLGWVLWRKKPWPVLRQKKFGWVLVSGFFFFLHLATYKFASKNTTVANTMILFALNPVWASLGAILFFREKLKPRLLLCYALSCLGIYLLVRQELHFANLDSASSLGDLSATVSAFFYAAYMLTGKKARQSFDNSIYSLCQFSVCALCFLLTALWTGKNFVGYDQMSWLTVVGLILLPTLLGHLTLTYLVQFMNLSVMSCGKLIEPVLASLMAYFIFNEVLRPEAWVAFCLTVLSVIILFLPDIHKRTQKF